jgi:uncharacterized protein YbaR (Trm112 family)
MKRATLDILRCPYCGGRLELVESLHHRANEATIHEGILGCQCCIFPVVADIPVLHLQPAAVEARGFVEEGRPDLALRALVGASDPARAEVVERAAASDATTYRDMVEALGPTLEGGYFLYRFSDPTYLVANAVVRAVGQAVLGGARRALDLCGGSGHMTRSLVGLSSPDPILADLFFAKIWLARRFTVPGCEAVCCDGNAPLPFARGIFGLVTCFDAFQFIWTKRQLVDEMSRLVDPVEGAVLIGHTHNQLAWSPSHGQPLSPDGYRDLFEVLPPRIFGEAGLFEDVVSGGPLDLSRADTVEALNHDPALTIVAAGAGIADRVFQPHALEPAGAIRAGHHLDREASQLRLNPLYQATAAGGSVRLDLRFPGADYDDEFGAAARRYLPETATLDAEAFDLLRRGRLERSTPVLDDLVRRRVILRLPERYY